MKTKIITLGYECGDRCFCKHEHECKYASGFLPKLTNKLHNFDVGIHRFFEYTLHIPFPQFPFYFSLKWEKFSGTSVCPYHLIKQTDCCECIHCCGVNCNCDFICELPRSERSSYNTDEWSYQCSRFSQRLKNKGV